jgi:hypothetical protein
VALGGFAQPPFWFQLSAFSISAFAKVWLCAALFLISAFSFQHFSFCPDVALGGFAQPPFWFQLSAFSISAFAKVWLWGGLPAQSRITNHESPPALDGSARPFDVGSWMLDVRCCSGLNPRSGRQVKTAPLLVFFEVGIFGDDHESISLGVFPNGRIVRFMQMKREQMVRVGKQIGKAPNQLWREVVVV